MRYAQMLPCEIDLLLLGVGEDGHIASLFPCSAVLQELERVVVPVIGPKPPFERITITPLAIRRARSVFILAGGAAKAAVLSKALESPDDVQTLPARLVLHATWLLDSSDAEPT
jgi:6-phosphogluconolactonase